MSLENASRNRAIVAQFHKSAGGRFDLWSVTVITEEPAKDGSGDIWLSRDIYSVDWSRKYGYLYHQTGAGGSGPVPVDSVYFASGDVQIEEQPCTLWERSKATGGRWRARAIRARNKTRRLRALPKFFRPERGDLFDWLEVNGIEGPSVYCSECADTLPGDQLCEHCWWCEEIGWYSTPSEPCKCRKRGLSVCKPTWLGEAA